MSILDAFRRRRDPTRQWREDVMVSLLADLDRFAFCGTGFGDEIAPLGFLGRSASGVFDYPGRGLRLDVESMCLSGFTLALRSDAYLGPTEKQAVEPFDGRIRILGRDWEPSALETEAQFIEAWSEPYWRDQDEDEVLLFFEFPRGEIQVELSLEGTPLVLVALAEPLMADPVQREMYGVKKTWPPHGGS